MRGHSRDPLAFDDDIQGDIHVSLMGTIIPTGIYFKSQNAGVCWAT